MISVSYLEGTLERSKAIYEHKFMISSKTLPYFRNIFHKSITKKHPNSDGL